MTLPIPSLVGRSSLFLDTSGEKYVKHRGTMFSLSSSTKVLVAALVLEKGGESDYSLGLLSLSCWKLFPQNFGLIGYEDLHPDSLRVGLFIPVLVSEQCLVESPNQLYSLTWKGHEIAYEAAMLCGIRTAERPRLLPPINQAPPEYADFLNRVLSGDAMWKIQQGLGTEVNLREAQVFWGVSKVDDIPRARQNLFTVLENARLSFRGIREVVLPGGRVVTRDDLDKVEQADLMLASRFGTHIKLMANRQKRRREDDKWKFRDRGLRGGSFLQTESGGFRLEYDST